MGHTHGPSSEAPKSEVAPMSEVALKGPAGEAAEKRQARRLLFILGLIAMFFVVELVGAKKAGSDALEADAYHLLMDVLALGVSLVALRLATLRPSKRFTFGLRRVEPLAGFVNGALVLGVAIELVRDAVQHVAHPKTPDTPLMIGVAIGALVVNGLSAWLLHGVMGHHHGHDHGSAHAHHGHAHEGHAHHEDEQKHEHEDDRHSHAHDAAEEHAGAGHHLSLRGVWLHLIGDALGSLAALAAGLLIRFEVSPVVDPIASFFVVAILVVGAVRLLRDATFVLIDAAPARVPVDKVEKFLLRMKGVTSVHALHVWSLGTGHDAVAAHVVADGTDPRLSVRASEGLRRRFAAEYVTVQVDVEKGAAAKVSKPDEKKAEKEAHEHQTSHEILR